MSLLSYTDTVIAPMRELVLQEKVADMPEIELKGDTDISLLVSNIATAAFTQEPTSSQKKRVMSMFDTMTEYFEDDTNIIRTQSTDHISKSLGSILENAYSTVINEIGSMVDDLRSQIEDKFAYYLKIEKADDLLDQAVEVTENDYTFLKWEKLRSPARHIEITEQACENINLNRVDLSVVNLGYIQSKLKFSDGFSTISLEKDTREAVLDSLLSTFTADSYGISEQRITRFLKVGLSQVDYSTFCATIQSQMKKITETPSNVIFLLQLANDFQTIMGRAKIVMADHTDSNTLSSFVKNLDSVYKTVTAVLYYCLYNKQVRFKDKLILTKNIINNETYQAFLKDGKTINDIHNYLKAYHLSTELPTGGISLELVMNSDVAERLNKAAAVNKTNAKFIKSKCLIKAYQYTLNTFIKQIMEEDLFGYTDDRSIVKKFAVIAKARSNMFGGDIGKVDDALYDVLISTFYSNDLTATVFSYMRKSMTDLSKSAESIDDVSILDAEVDASVYMLTDYLFDKLTVHRNTLKGSSPHT